MISLRSCGNVAATLPKLGIWNVAWCERTFNTMNVFSRFRQHSSFTASSMLLWQANYWRHGKLFIPTNTGLCTVKILTRSLLISFKNLTFHLSTRRWTHMYEASLYWVRQLWMIWSLEKSSWKKIGSGKSAIRSMLANSPHQWNTFRTSLQELSKRIWILYY